MTAENAIDIIAFDPNKPKDAREENAEFIRRLRRNEFVKFGVRNWEQQGRFDRAAVREIEQREQEPLGMGSEA